VPEGKRLVLALEDDARIDQLHACGGNARCTTCRVQFLAREPPRMTVAEKAVLAARGLTGVRLSCQILCDHDMAVRAISRLAGSGRTTRTPLRRSRHTPRDRRRVPRDLRGRGVTGVPGGAPADPDEGGLLERPRHCLPQPSAPGYPCRVVPGGL